MDQADRFLIFFINYGALFACLAFVGICIATLVISYFSSKAIKQSSENLCQEYLRYGKISCLMTACLASIPAFVGFIGTLIFFKNLYVPGGVLIFCFFVPFVNYKANTRKIFTNFKHPAIAKEFTQTEYPELWVELGKVLQRASLPLPEKIIGGYFERSMLVDEEIKTRTGETFQSRATLLLSVPQCILLSRKEMHAVITRELSIFASSETGYLNFIRTYGDIAHKFIAEPFGGATTIPIDRFFASFGKSLMEWEKTFEVEADLKGVSVSTKNTMIAAILRTRLVSDSIKKEVLRLWEAEDMPFINIMPAIEDDFDKRIASLERRTENNAKKSILFELPRCEAILENKNVFEYMSIAFDNRELSYLDGLGDVDKLAGSFFNEAKI